MGCMRGMFVPQVGAGGERRSADGLMASIREGLGELQGFPPAAAASRLSSVGAAHRRKGARGSGGGRAIRRFF